MLVVTDRDGFKWGLFFLGFFFFVRKSISEVVTLMDTFRFGRVCWQRYKIILCKISAKQKLSRQEKFFAETI